MTTVDWGPLPTMPEIECESCEKLKEELAALNTRYEERGMAMRDTAAVVRSLYVGSEVSKRMRNLTIERDHYRMALMRIADTTPGEYMIADTPNDKLICDFAREALEKK